MLNIRVWIASVESVNDADGWFYNIGEEGEVNPIWSEITEKVHDLGKIYFNSYNDDFSLQFNDFSFKVWNDTENIDFGKLIKITDQSLHIIFAGAISEITDDDVFLNITAENYILRELKKNKLYGNSTNPAIGYPISSYLNEPDSNAVIASIYGDGSYIKKYSGTFTASAIAWILEIIFNKVVKFPLAINQNHLDSYCFNSLKMKHLRATEFDFINQSDDYFIEKRQSGRIWNSNSYFSRDDEPFLFDIIIQYLQRCDWTVISGISGNFEGFELVNIKNFEYYAANENNIMDISGDRINYKKPARSFYINSKDTMILDSDKLADLKIYDLQKNKGEQEYSFMNGINIIMPANPANWGGNNTVFAPFPKSRIAATEQARTQKTDYVLKYKTEIEQDNYINILECAYDDSKKEYSITSQKPFQNYTLLDCYTNITSNNFENKQPLMMGLKITDLDDDPVETAVLLNFLEPVDLVITDIKKFNGSDYVNLSNCSLIKQTSTCYLLKGTDLITGTNIYTGFLESNLLFNSEKFPEPLNNYVFADGYIMVILFYTVALDDYNRWYL